ncbi:response regulator transcription factor [Clostridium sp. UBA1056]|uniref:response regulator transcription factor n=1 Tax=unclassified Clostridium TaxID=2614128 RepID=UPI0032171113
MNNYNILIIDDQRETVELMEMYLKNEWYNVFKALNGADGINLIKNHRIHLILLDIMMLEIDGMKIYRKIRNALSIPIIRTSTKVQGMDKILDLSIGAYDYMTKPFNPMELITRVKSQLRRSFYFNETLKAQKDEKHFESNNTVMVHMWRLREKIEEGPKNPKFIEMVWGGGYKIEK